MAPPPTRYVVFTSNVSAARWNKTAVNIGLLLSACNVCNICYLMSSLGPRASTPGDSRTTSTVMPPRTAVRPSLIDIANSTPPVWSLFAPLLWTALLREWVENWRSILLGYGYELGSTAIMDDSYEVRHQSQMYFAVGAPVTARDFVYNTRAGALLINGIDLLQSLGSKPVCWRHEHGARPTVRLSSGAVTKLSVIRSRHWISCQNWK